MPAVDVGVDEAAAAAAVVVQGVAEVAVVVVQVEVVVLTAAALAREHGMTRTRPVGETTIERGVTTRRWLEVVLDSHPFEYQSVDHWG